MINGIDLEALKSKAALLLSLLSHPTPGYMAWNEALRDTLADIKKLAEEAGL